MRTTIDIDPELLKEALKWTGEKSKGRVVDKALEEMVRRRKIEKLIELAQAGKFTWEGDLEKWEEDELRHRTPPTMGMKNDNRRHRHLG